MGSDILNVVVPAAIYVLAGRAVLRSLTGRAREVTFAILNLAGVFWFLFYSNGNHSVRFQTIQFAFYLALIVFQYGMLRAFADQKGGWPWLAFFTPIAALIVVRYVPFAIFLKLGGTFGLAWHGHQASLALVGLSYLAFRCSRLVLEIRNGIVKKPGFWEYLHFSFFLPTMSVGPINTYENYRRGFQSVPEPIPAGRAALRVLIGLVKYLFLGSLCGQLSYAGLLLNEHPHPWVDLPVAMIFYYLFLYCNFSGFCDMAIGAAGLIGIPVPENFNNPFAARNMKEFWNRWHITLSAWMRDLVFAPLSKRLVRWMGPSRANHAIALSILATFLLIGIWHGVGWNYAAFGLAQALGVATVHYYTLFLKKRLGRDGFKAYNENRWIHGAGVAITFGYFAVTLFLFANTFDQMREIFSVLR